jgi:hypothetical protein
MNRLHAAMSQYGIIDTCGFPKDSFFYLPIVVDLETSSGPFPALELAGAGGTENRGLGLQATKSSGTVTVEVASPGLVTATATISAKSVGLRPRWRCGSARFRRARGSPGCGDRYLHSGPRLGAARIRNRRGHNGFYTATEWE